MNFSQELKIINQFWYGKRECNYSIIWTHYVL